MSGQCVRSKNRQIVSEKDTLLWIPGGMCTVLLPPGVNPIAVK
jgi:hypothetical protein